MSHIITAQDLEVRFSGCHALRGIDLKIESGTIFALLGENGAGKTTLIRLLTGFLKPSLGQCRVLGLDPATDAQTIRQRVGYVSDAPALYDWMQVGEIGWFAAAFYPDGYLERYRESIAKYELPEDRKIKHLSKGQRAKVALSLAVAHDPELLILDEPTSGLDPLVRREFMESMLDRAATGRTVLLSSHQISEVKRVADTIAILHQGKLQVVESLQSLRESIYEVTVNVDDPLATMPELESPAVLLSEITSGRQRQWMVCDYTEEIGERLRQTANIVSVQARHATLDEIFVAYTKFAAAQQRPNTSTGISLAKSSPNETSRKTLVEETP